MSNMEISNIRREKNRAAHEIALYVRITGSCETWLAQVPEAADQDFRSN
jgi:hypothetical protein